MVLSDVLRCVLYNIVWPCWFWPWHCLTYTKHIEECQTIPWPKPNRTNYVIQNTSKNVRHYHGQNQQGKAMHNIVCPCWFWPWYCLTFIDVFYITLFFLLGFGDGTMLYKTHRRTSDNTIAKTKKEKQCYIKHIDERQTIPWPSLLVLAMVLSDVLRCV
jgi:hypothetical protein